MSWAISCRSSVAMPTMASVQEPVKAALRSSCKQRCDHACRTRLLLSARRKSSGPQPRKPTTRDTTKYGRAY
jgi:hypothetical protein